MPTTYAGVIIVTAFISTNLNLDTTNMSEANSSQELLETLYGAATDNHGWAQFCRHINQQTGCPVTMFGHSLDSGQSLGFVAGGWDETWLQSYVDYYGPLNSWMSLNVAMKPGMIAMSDYAMPRSRLLTTEYYNDWLRPQEDLIAGVAMICHRSENGFLAIGAACRNSHVDDDLPKLCDLFKTLSPHIMRTINISSTLCGDNGTTEGQFHTSRFAVFMVHQSGRVGYRNPAAVCLLEQQSILRLGSNKRLWSTEESTRVQLNSQLTAITQRNFENLDSPMPITLADNKIAMLHAHIFPPEEGRKFPESVWSDPIIGCIVITGQGGLESSNADAILKAGFAATVAEARLGQAVVAGQSLYDYADQNALSRHTVRNQMRALLAKTSTCNQSDFVRKLAGLISPFWH